MVSPGSELLRDPPIGQINLWVRSQHHHPVPQLSAEMGDSGGWTSCFMVEEEVEVEWRTVALRFGVDSTPTPGQRGSTSNAVFTAKYTALSFLPKGIFEQFRRVANVYFLGISIMMAVGTYVPGTWFSSLDPWTTIGPLALIVGLTLTKEGIEDSKRHKADRAVNSRTAQVLCADGSFQAVGWSTLQPGMVLRIEDRQEFPADLVPLASSEEAGKCYIETANIDGETNLKLRAAAFGAECFTSGADLIAAATEDGGSAVALSFEPPSASIHAFNATLAAGTAKGKGALGAEHLLLRGALLRNTKWILGAVVYTGKETKLVMNSRDAPSKLSTIETMVNSMIYFILGAMVVLTSLTLMGYALWMAEHDDELYYLCHPPLAGTDPLFEAGCDQKSWDEYPLWTLWPTFFILYNNFLPISLYVTMELVNVAQAYFIDQDLRMYHEEQDTPALARTSNMNGDLGQIEYVFSDKTGTLTCNEMKFRRCTVGESVFGAPLVEPNLLEGSSSTATGASASAASKLPSWQHLEALPRVVAAAAASLSPAHHVASLLACCHNVVVENGAYLAESPDEEALVDGGVTMGLTYQGQTGDQLSLSFQASPGATAEPRSMTLLATVPFSSQRKRMSVVVKDAQGQHWLYCKGADNVVFDRTCSSSEGYDLVGGRAKIMAQLEVFAAEGLRTLVLAYRKLSAKEASDWCAEWKRATEATSDRTGALEKAAAAIEKDLLLLGSTGIEDRLQDGVPECIASIKAAGVKVWVLTGDKMTTAIEIGRSCELLTPDLSLIVLEAEPPEGDPGHGVSVAERLATAHRKALYKRLGEGFNPNAPPLANGLVVDGPSLSSILGTPQEKLLLELACSCAAVVACRVSPAQKQLIVKMVKDGLPNKPITLSIGDGANDVPMIQEAQIGVGISGKEGRQAVNSSDFAIAQFRFLEPLLLVHGRWNYRRIAKVVLYSFYKNIVLTIVLAWWTMDCGYSGQSLYESYVYAAYNFFLGMPILLLGIFDQDVLADTALQFQTLYSVGLNKADLNVRVMAQSFLQACGDAAILYYLTLGCFNGPGLANGDASSSSPYASSPGSVWEGSTGEGFGIWVFGTAVYTNMVTAMLVKVALMHNSWSSYAFGGMAFSLALYWGFVMLYGSFEPVGDGFVATWLASYEFYYAPQKMVASGGFWLSAVAVPGVVNVADMFLLAVSTQLFTGKTHAAREWEVAAKSKDSGGAPAVSPQAEAHYDNSNSGGSSSVLGSPI